MRIERIIPRPGALSRWRTVARAFARDRDGVISIEMAFATIVFTLLITGMISFGSLFFIKGSMADAARDTVRRMATGEFTTVQAQTYAQAHLINWGMTYSVTATNDGTDATVNISVPIADAALIDFLGIFSGDLSTSVTMPVES